MVDFINPMAKLLLVLMAFSTIIVMSYIYDYISMFTALFLMSILGARTMYSLNKLPGMNEEE